MNRKTPSRCDPAIHACPKGGVLLITYLCLLAARVSVQADSLLPMPVRIETGQLAGSPNQQGDVVSFKGIPYATPPVGPLRWREPQPAMKWEGIRQADAFSASCTQPASGLTPPYTSEFAATGPTSEDCLYLNVWTPARAREDMLAVLFYIHGGSGTRGSGSIPVYDGENLAKKGIIVITVNFRLGIFSGMGHPELTAESPNHTCGNYGMLDLIAALKWVRDNIRSFGGDPAKVTIWGQSSGAVAVHYLTTSPLAKGLFRSAIAMSFPYDYLTKQHAIGNVWQKEQEGLKFAAAKNVKTIEELRKIPARELIAADAAVGAFTRACLSGSPNIDGWSFILKYPEALDAGLESDVPTLTGFTVDDFGQPARYLKTSVDSFAEDLSVTFGERRADFAAVKSRFITQCPVATEREAREMIKRIQNEYRMCDTFRWAARRARTAETPVYTYIFQQPIPWPEHPQYGAFHSSDLVYWFANLAKLDRPWTADDLRISEQVSSYLVNFVKTGSPNGEGLPDWPAFDPAVPLTMALGLNSAPGEIAVEARYAFYRDLWK